MARTFIGELILRLKDEMSGKARTVANNLDTSVEKIQRAAQQLNKTTWGGSFEEKLRKLGTSAAEIDKLRVAWDSLHTSMTSRNLSKSMQAMEKSNFKTSALGYFAEIAAKAKEADTSIGNMHARLKDAVKDIATYGTIGTIVYGGANAVRGGFNASAEYQREIFRQENANIPKVEQLKIAAEADRLTSLYPSAGITDVMEMARQARNMMGTTDRGLAILPDLVKSLVALQTSKGVDAAPAELSELLRGIDNAGQNVGGPLGIKQTQEIIAGLVRASQIEGRELDVGSLWTFMRRAKIAGPGFSTEFLANVVPALIQDMSAPGAGTALSSGFQAYMIGSNAVASKANLAEQERLGIRKNGKLVQGDLFAANPYEWSKQVFLKALEADGVDINDNAAIASATAKTSRNTPATAMITKMMQQREQMDRLIQQYREAAGPDSADAALAIDPFVAARGFVESLREVATSIKGMPEVTGILNSMTDGLQRFATALREQDGGAQALLAGGGALGAFAGFKMLKGIWDLSTAGTSLQMAAASLEGAALSLKAASGADVASDLKKPGVGSKAGWLGLLGTAGVVAATGLTSGDDPHNTYSNASEEERAAMRERARRAASGKSDLELNAIDAGNYRRLLESVMSRYNPNTPGVDRYFNRDGVDPTTTGSTTQKAKPDVDMSSADAALQKAGSIGGEIVNALSVIARPQVDNASLQETLRLVNAIKAGLQGIGGLVQQASASVSRQMNRNFTDQGVTP